MNKRMQLKLEDARDEVWTTLQDYGIHSQFWGTDRLKVSNGPSLHFSRHAKQPTKLYVKGDGLTWGGAFDMNPRRFDQSRTRNNQLDFDAITLWVATWRHRKIELSVATKKAGRPHSGRPK